MENTKKHLTKNVKNYSEIQILAKEVIPSPKIPSKSTPEPQSKITYLDDHDFETQTIIFDDQEDEDGEVKNN